MRKVAIAFFLCALFSNASAVVINGSLNPGDQFRIVYVTTNTYQGTSNVLATYDSAVSSNAGVLTTQLAGLGYTVGSYSAIVALQSASNVRVNTGMLGTGVPIFDVNGNLIANNYTDFWDGTLFTPGIRFNEVGASAAGAATWTGFNATGGYTPPNGLGDGGGAYFGRAGDIGPTWATFGSLDETAGPRLYGISAVLTVPDAQNIPEPPIYAALLTAFGLITYRRYLARA